MRQSDKEGTEKYIKLLEKQKGENMSTEILSKSILKINP